MYFRLGLLLAAFALVAAGQEKKRIFIITDGEGVAGICRQDQTPNTDPELRALLTGEVNAAVDGFLQGGADEVIVWDGHGGANNLSATTIHPRAKLVMGGLNAAITLERKYTAVAFVGQHAMANVQNAIMGHSFNSLGIQNMKVNGKNVGEIETRVAMAGHYDTPVIFLSGDRAAADEMRALVPDAEYAIVKEALSRYSCETLSAEGARNLITEKARASMAKLKTVKPYRIAGPVTLEIEYTTRYSLGPDARLIPFAEVVDDRTIRFKGKDLLEVWGRYRTTTVR